MLLVTRMSGDIRVRASRPALSLGYCAARPAPASPRLARLGEVR
jgi:hypothetical protein